MITDSNLSAAWAKAFLHVLQGGDGEPLVVSIRDFDNGLPPQDVIIAEMLNSKLRAANIPTIDQTALTIVPFQRWLRTNRPSVRDLSSWYLDQMLPRLKARCSKNRHGTYFERFVDYTGVKGVGAGQEIRRVNQLEFVTELWRRRAAKGLRPRQSALQLACFDPAKDHTGSALAGFPCLQQVSFTYKEVGTIEINAFYPTQYIFDRAYGNYLGLCQLGYLIAHELDVRFSAFTCFIACPEVGSGTKAAHAELADALRVHLESAHKDCALDKAALSSIDGS